MSALSMHEVCRIWLKITTVEQITKVLYNKNRWIQTEAYEPVNRRIVDGRRRKDWGRRRRSKCKYDNGDTWRWERGLSGRYEPALPYNNWSIRGWSWSNEDWTHKHSIDWLSRGVIGENASRPSNTDLRSQWIIFSDLSVWLILRSQNRLRSADGNSHWKSAVRIGRNTGRQTETRELAGIRIARNLIYPAGRINQNPEWDRERPTE